MIARIVSTLGIVAAVVLLFFVNMTTPATAGPLGILTVFLCLYAIVFSILSFVLFWGSQLFIRLSSPFTAKRPLTRLSFRQAYYFASILALVPVMIVAIQSVGTVSIYEVGLIVLFVVLGCFYIAKRSV